MEGVVPLEEGVSRSSGCGSMCEAGMRLLEVSSSPCEGHLSKAWLSRMLLLLFRPNSATKKPFVWSWAGLALRQWSAGRGRRTGVHVEQTTLKYLWSAPTYLIDLAHQHLLATAAPKQWDTSCMCVCVT